MFETHTRSNNYKFTGIQELYHPKRDIIHDKNNSRKVYPNANISHWAKRTHPIKIHEGKLLNIIGKVNKKFPRERTTKNIFKNAEELWPVICNVGNNLDFTKELSSKNVIGGTNLGKSKGLGSLGTTNWGN